MKSNNIKKIFMVFICTNIIGINSYAHGGRTDSSGGHKDKDNVSGLGAYHYHCGGHPAHLHEDGVCPYSSNSSQKKSVTSSETATSTSSSFQEYAEKTESTKDIEVLDIQINEDVESMKVGEAKILSVAITPIDATEKNITWKSSDDSVASISSAGLLITKKPGIVYITAIAYNGKISTIKINIKEEPQIEDNSITKNSNGKASNTSVYGSNYDQDSNTFGGILTLGLLGGAGYIGYKKHKK